MESSDRRGARIFVAAWLAVATFAGAARAHAAQALVDLLDGETLEQVQPNASAAPDRALDLLLVEVVRERIAAGALGYTTDVPVVVVGGDPGASLAAHARLPISELLQLALLARSRSAIATLAAAVGPGCDRARQRMRRAASRLGLRGTTVPDGWPGEGDRGARGTLEDGGRKAPSAAATLAGRRSEGRTTVGDIARLAAAVASDGAIRRRLALDGAPIANGAVIVRAIDPLIVRTRASAAPATTASTQPAGADARTAIAIGERGGLVLLAVASGPDAAHDVWTALERGLTRYRRIEIVRAGQTVGGNVEGRDGIIRHLTAVAAQSFAITIPRSGVFALVTWLQRSERDEMPAQPSRAVGELVFEVAGRIVGAVPLVAPPPTAPSRWLDTASR